MAQNVTIAGASYSDVPSVELPKTGGGYAEFVDATTVVQSNWNENDQTSLAYVQNRPFYESDPDAGSPLKGTASTMIYILTLSSTSGSIDLVEGDEYIVHIPTGADTEETFTITGMLLNGEYSLNCGSYGTVTATYSNQIAIGDEAWVKNGTTGGVQIVSSPNFGSSKDFYFTAGSDFETALFSASGQIEIEHVTTHQIDKKFIPLNHETWTFTLSDSTTVTKDVVLW